MNKQSAVSEASVESLQEAVAGWGSARRRARRLQQQYPRPTSPHAPNPEFDCFRQALAHEAHMWRHATLPDSAWEQALAQLDDEEDRDDAKRLRAEAREVEFDPHAQDGLCYARNWYVPVAFWQVDLFSPHQPARTTLVGEEDPEEAFEAEQEAHAALDEPEGPVTSASFAEEADDPIAGLFVDSVNHMLVEVGQELRHLNQQAPQEKLMIDAFGPYEAAHLHQMELPSLNPAWWPEGLRAQLGMGPNEEMVRAGVLILRARAASYEGVSMLAPLIQAVVERYEAPTFEGEEESIHCYVGDPMLREKAVLEADLHRWYLWSEAMVSLGLPEGAIHRDIDVQVVRSPAHEALYARAVASDRNAQGEPMAQAVQELFVGNNEERLWEALQVMAQTRSPQIHWQLRQVPMATHEHLPLDWFDAPEAGRTVH